MSAKHRPARNTIIACVVSTLIGLLGGFLGRDLSALEKPATDAAIGGADLIEDAAAKKK